MASQQTPLTNQMTTQLQQFFATLPQATNSPPPYSEYSDEEEEERPIINLTISAGITIHGNNNIITTPPTDAARIATLVASTLKTSSSNINLRVECGITIRGDRNVVGSIGRPLPIHAAQAKAAQAQMLAQKQQQMQASIQAGLATPPVSPINGEGMSRKRKNEDSEPEGAPNAKEMKIEDAAPTA